jgi:phosphate transport system permease protein
MGDPYRRRKVVDLAVRGACVAATLLAIVPLASVLAYVIAQGISGLSWSFFTELPRPVGESGGGMANAIVGSLELIGLASLFGIPAGVLAAVYLAEFGKGGFGRVVRFCADVMTGVPSIVVGMFVYTLLVLTMRRFSAIAGGVALAILMLPTLVRSTEEVVRLVPHSYRQGALALGAPRWKVIQQVVLPAAAPAIATAALLSVARAAGETAPLLFTALGNRFWSVALDRPIASLPVMIYDYARSAYEDWNRQAWTGALVLLLLLTLVSALLRITLRRTARG